MKEVVKPQRKYQTYHALFNRLRRLKIPKAGKLATLLLDTFIGQQGKLYAESVELSDLLSPNETFKEWRKKLVRLGVLKFTLKHGKTGSKYASYEPGIKIISLIDKERRTRANEPVATMKSNLADTVAFLESELESLKQVVMNLCQVNKLSLSPQIKPWVGLQKPVNVPTKVNLNKYKQNYVPDDEEDLLDITTKFETFDDLEDF